MPGDPGNRVKAPRSHHDVLQRYAIHIIHTVASLDAHSAGVEACSRLDLIRGSWCHCTGLEGTDGGQ